MFVVFIHGPVAAGKHTIGVRLGESLGLPLFHNHLAVDLTTTLFDFGTTPFKNLRAGIWRTAFAEAAKARRSFIFTFSPESTVQPDLIAELVGLVKAEGGHVHFVELRCSDAAIRDRIGNESRRNFGKLVDADLHREITKQGGFDFPAMPDPLIVIDTEASTIDESVASIRSALSEQQEDGHAD